MLNRHYRLIFCDSISIFYLSKKEKNPSCIWFLIGFFSDCILHKRESKIIKNVNEIFYVRANTKYIIQNKKLSSTISRTEKLGYKSRGFYTFFLFPFTLNQVLIAFEMGKWNDIFTTNKYFMDFIQYLSLSFFILLTIIL